MNSRTFDDCVSVRKKLTSNASDAIMDEILASPKDDPSPKRKKTVQFEPIQRVLTIDDQANLEMIQDSIDREYFRYLLLDSKDGI
jgi:hypothetical protein